MNKQSKKVKLCVNIVEIICCGLRLPKVTWQITIFSIYTLSDLGVLSNLIGSLSLANEHYSPPTE